MKTIITMLNSKYIHSSLAPWCLLAGVRAYCCDGIDAQVAEGTINEKKEDVIERLVSLGGDLYGFCCYIWNIEFVKDVAMEVKKKTNAKIVLGGPEVSFNSEEILNSCDFVDFVLSGEGEKSFAELCNAVKFNTDLKRVHGLCYRSEKGIYLSEPVYEKCEAVSPYTEDYFSALNGRIAYVEASRGCPFSCAFCLSGRCNSLVLYDIERVKNEIILLSNAGTKTVKFIDRTFNAKEERANEILNFIIENRGEKIPLDVCFHFEIDGGTLKNSTLEILKNAPVGLFQLEIGLQSFNFDTLKAVHRNPNTDNLAEIIKTFSANGNMHIHADLIAGLPYEGLESFKHSFNKLYVLKPHMLQLGFLKLLHGSELREKCDAYEYIFSEKPPYTIKSTKWLQEDEMQIIHYAEEAVDRLYNSGRFLNTLEFLFDECHFEPFGFFASFGKEMYGKNNISLDCLVTLLYNFLLEKVEKTRLRDVLVTDVFSSVKGAVLPEVLKVADKNLKQLKKHLAENLQLAGKYSCALLYSKNKAVYCDYKEKNPITGRYKLTYLEIAL